jgi:hypothetical protein
MSKSPKSSFAAIDPTQLAKVSGGASRVTARVGGANDQLTTMLTSITDSIKNMNANKGMDPMMMMVMMMMMGGGGGGGGGAPAQMAAPPPPPPAPVINITTDIRRRW